MEAAIAQLIDALFWPVIIFAGACLAVPALIALLCSR